MRTVLHLALSMHAENSTQFNSTYMGNNVWLVHKGLFGNTNQFQNNVHVLKLGLHKTVNLHGKNHSANFIFLYQIQAESSQLRFSRLPKQCSLLL